MRSGPVAKVAIAALLAACASPTATMESAVEDARRDVHERVGTEPPPWTRSEDRTGVGDDVGELLAGELSEDDAVRVALLNNREVRAAYERLGIAAADLVQAGLVRNPVFVADAIFFFDGGSEIEFGIAQPFFDLFLRPLRERVAAHELAAAQARMTHQLVHLAFEVRREFARLRAAAQLVELQQQGLAAAVASHELMRGLHDAGNVVDPMLTIERIGEAQARLELAAAERAAREAREPLNRLLGLFGKQVGWQIGGRLPPSALGGLDLEAVETRSVARSLDLRENRAAIERAAQLAGLRSWEGWFPDGEIGVSAKREDGWGMGPTAAIELPLWDRGQARLAGAEALVRAHLDHHVQLAVEVRSAARLVRDRLELLEQRAQFLREELLPTQARLVRETARDYNAMQIGVFQVLQQKQQYLATGREYVTTLRDAWLARLDLEELLAGSIPSESLAPFWPANENSAARETGGH